MHRKAGTPREDGLSYPIYSQPVTITFLSASGQSVLRLEQLCDGVQRVAHVPSPANMAARGLLWPCCQKLVQKPSHKVSGCPILVPRVGYQSPEGTPQSSAGWGADGFRGSMPASTRQVTAMENTDKQTLLSSWQDNPRGPCPSLGSAPRSLFIWWYTFLGYSAWDLPEKLYKKKTVSTSVATICETQKCDLYTPYAVF